MTENNRLKQIQTPMYQDASTTTLDEFINHAKRQFSERVITLYEIAKDTNVKSGKYVVFIGDSNKDGKRDSDWKQTVVKYANDYNKEAVLNESRNTKDKTLKIHKVS